jgi:hypothetical protein
MKHLLFVLSLLFVIPASYAQTTKENTSLSILPVSPDTDLITYEGVIEVAGMDKAVLYSRAYNWLAKTYRSSTDVIQVQDKETGELVAKGLVRVTSRGRDAGSVLHTLTIYIKDGRCKYVLTNLVHQAGTSSYLSGGPLEQQKAHILPAGMFGAQRAWTDIRASANTAFYQLVNNLITAMTLKGIKDPRDF